MSDEIKILGQSKPAATTLTDLYTVPSEVQTTVSTLFCCNQSGAGETVRVSVAVDGATDATSHYLYYDKAISANDTLEITRGITLSSDDIIRVYSGSGNVSFVLFGVETA